MEQITYFAQTPGYNCVGANDSSYGASAYGTCDTTTNSSGDTTNNNSGTVQPGAPNTGEFFGFVTSGAFTIVAPLVVAIIVAVVASFVIARKKRASQR